MYALKQHCEESKYEAEWPGQRGGGASLGACGPKVVEHSSPINFHCAKCVYYSSRTLRVNLHTITFFGRQVDVNYRFLGKESVVINVGLWIFMVIIYFIKRYVIYLTQFGAWPRMLN